MELMELQSGPGTPTFEMIFNMYSWKEIKNCPGRFVLTKKSSSADQLTPLQVRLKSQVISASSFF